MATTKYTYSKAVNVERLQSEIVAASDITIALDNITAKSASVDVYMKASLVALEETALDDLVAAHVNEPLPAPTLLLDADGATLTRPKMAATGRHYQLHGMSFTTAGVGSFKQPDTDGVNRAYGELSFFDHDNTPCSGIENMHKVCKTIVDWEPPFDYEIMGGKFHQYGSPSGELILNVVALPDIPASYGGNVEFVLATDLRFIGPDTGLDILGHTTSELIYSATQHTNKIRMSLHHASGVQHEMYIGFEIFVGG